jgi:Na+-driven multidrug efflux pump
MVGLYVFALPAALLGLVTPLGVAGLYAAVILEKLVPAVLNGIRFRSNRWQAVSRQYRPASADGEGSSE